MPHPIRTSQATKRKLARERLQPAPKKHRSLWWAALITVLGWALLTYPGLFVFVITASSFTGCFVTCTTPNPGTGVLGVAVLVVMLATPLLIGLAFARRRRGLWIAAICCAVPLLAALIYFAAYGMF